MDRSALGWNQACLSSYIKLRAKYARAHTSTHVAYRMQKVGTMRREAILPSGRGELQKSDRNCRLQSAPSAISRWTMISFFPPFGNVGSILLALFKFLRVAYLQVSVTVKHILDIRQDIDSTNNFSNCIKF